MNCILVQLLSIRPFDIVCMSGREELGDGDTANSFPCACSVAVDFVCVSVLVPIHCNFDLSYVSTMILYISWLKCSSLAICPEKEH